MKEVVFKKVLFYLITHTPFAIGNRRLKYIEQLVTKFTHACNFGRRRNHSLWKSISAKYLLAKRGASLNGHDGKCWWYGKKLVLCLALPSVSSLLSSGLLIGLDTPYHASPGNSVLSHLFVDLDFFEVLIYYGHQCDSLVIGVWFRYLILFWSCGRLFASWRVHCTTDRSVVYLGLVLLWRCLLYVFLT